MQQIDTVTRRVTTRFGHERQRHDLIGGSETRTVGARRVLDTYIYFNAAVRKLEFSSVRFMCCEPYFVITRWLFRRQKSDHAYGTTGLVVGLDSSKRQAAAADCC